MDQWWWVNDHHLMMMNQWWWMGWIWGANSALGDAQKPATCKPCFSSVQFSCSIIRTFQGHDRAPRPIHLGWIWEPWGETLLDMWTGSAVFFDESSHALMLVVSRRLLLKLKKYLCSPGNILEWNRSGIQKRAHGGPSTTTVKLAKCGLLRLNKEFPC